MNPLPPFISSEHSLQQQRELFTATHIIAVPRVVYDITTTRSNDNLNQQHHLQTINHRNAIPERQELKNSRSKRCYCQQKTNTVKNTNWCNNIFIIVILKNTFVEVLYSPQLPRVHMATAARQVLVGDGIVECNILENERSKFWV